MSDEIDWDGLGDYLSGRATEAERANVERLARESAAHALALAEARRLWERAGTLREPVGDVDAADVNRFWNGLAARIRASDAATTAAFEALPGARRSDRAPVPARRAVARRVPFADPGSPHRLASSSLRAAAALIAIVGGAALIRQAVQPAAESPASRAVREVTTAPGQRAEIRLDDGSRVVLGVASRLRWRPNFDRREREVELEGQALFVVAHEQDRSFVVRSGNAMIRDIGTEFGVSAYAGEPQVRVAVRAGAVVVAPAADTSSQRAMLRAGDVATLATDGALRVRHDADIARELAFADGRLEFADIPVQEVARQLERWYDVRVLVRDRALAEARVSASFEPDAELGAVLDQLGASLGARVTRQGRTISFDVPR